MNIDVDSFFAGILIGVALYLGITIVADTLDTRRVRRSERKARSEGEWNLVTEELQDLQETADEVLRQLRQEFADTAKKSDEPYDWKKEGN